MPATGTTHIEDQLSDLLDDRTFHEIDSRFHRFNLFEAVGAVRAELRHSNFLAYILSPTRPHGLGSEILERVLRALISLAPREARPVAALDLLVRDLDTAVIERERDNIDILIEVKPLNLVVVIENKVGASVGDGQLAGYKDIVRQRYPHWRHFFCLLNPDGSRPSAAYDDLEYHVFSYGELSSVLSRYVEDRNSSISDEVRLILRNYLEALRRHVVEDNELKEIARQLYFKHKEAFDFVFDCRPAAGDLLEPLRLSLTSNKEFILDRPAPGLIRFALADWAKIEALNSCPAERWTRSKRNLLFEIQTHNRSPRVNVSLILGPSEDAFRQHVYDEASKRSNAFVGLVKPMGLHHSTIYVRDLISARAAEGMNDEQKSIALETAWRDFMENDLLPIKAAISEIVASHASIPPAGTTGAAK